MLTYHEWKKIKDWVNWILDKGSFLIEGAIELGLAEFGIVPPFSSVIAWLVTKAIRWGVSWLLDLIPHEAEKGVGVHKGNMEEFRMLGDEPPTTVELKRTAKAIPLVPLRIPANQRTDLRSPAVASTAGGAMPLTPLDAPHGFTPLDGPYFNPADMDLSEVKRTDSRIQQKRIPKTAPFISTGNPVLGSPTRGFYDPAEAFTKGRILATIT